MQAAGLKLLANRANGDFSRLKYSINKTTNHFAPLQPSAAGAFFQDFALLFGIVTALQRSLLGHDRSYGGRRVRPAATGRHRSSSSIRCRRLRCCDRRRSPSCTHCSCDRYSSSTGTTNTVRRHSRQTGAIDTRRRYRPVIARLLFSNIFEFGGGERGLPVTVVVVAGRFSRGIYRNGGPRQSTDITSQRRRRRQ